MLIPIKRSYLNLNTTIEVILNTNYIIKIEPAHQDDKPKTRIVLDGKSLEGADVIYTDQSVSYIKGLVTKARNKKQEIEE
jgi:hypothetical protein